MHLYKGSAALVTLAVLVSSPASAREMATVTRLDAKTVELDRGDSAPVSVWISADTRIDDGDRRVAATA
ncbi:MAG: hypothetical protein P8Y58_14150, partial [Novosphingobium sp.]